MQYKRIDQDLVLRLEVGEDIAEQLLAVAEKEKISLASVSGIGALDSFEVGVFDLEAKGYEKLSYSGNHEITALSGNITTMDGAPYVHLHISCADRTGRIVGGHLLSSRISVTAEIFVRIFNGSVTRKHQTDLNFNRMEL